MTPLPEILGTPGKNGGLWVERAFVTRGPRRGWFITLMPSHVALLEGKEQFYFNVTEK